MADNNLGLILGVGIGALAICGVIYYINKSSNNKTKTTSKVTVTKDFNNEASQNIRVKKIMDKYFENIRENYSQYNLLTFYSRVLDIKEYKKDFNLDDNLHKTFGEIGLSSEEENYAYKYMRSIIEGIYKKHNLELNEMEEIRYRPFLEKYYEFIGMQEALEILKFKTEKIDEWKAHYEKNNTYILELLKKYSL